MAEPDRRVRTLGARLASPVRESRSAVLALDAHTQVPPAAGGKAHGLARLIALNLLVPPTWVVLPGADSEELRSLARELRALGHERLIVRSSAVGEDGQQIGFAGVHESLLDVPPEALPDAVLRVASSAFSTRAQAYRRAHGLGDATSALAVVVQPLLACRCSGVAWVEEWPRVPLSIEVVSGRGARLQEGEARPERWTIRAATDGSFACDRSAGSDQPDGALLTEVEATSIARTALQLASQDGRAVDLEWVAGAEGLQYVQWRVGTRSASPGLPPGETWTRANLGETFPEIPSALTRSLLPLVSGGGLARLLGAMGLAPPDGTVLCTSVAGRPVLNERAYALADVLGLGAARVQTYVGASRASGAGGRGVAISKVLRHPWTAWRAFRTLSSAEREARAALSLIEGALVRLEASASPEASLGTLARQLEGEALATLQRASSAAAWVFAALIWRQQTAEASLAGHPHPRAALARLVAAGPPTANTRRVLALVGLADRLRCLPGVQMLLDLPAPERSRAEAWHILLGGDAMQHVRTYVAAWGHRARLESDLARPRPQDDLAALREELAPLLVSPVRPRATDATSAESASWHDARRTCGPVGRLLLRRRVMRLRRLTALREEVRDRTIALLGALRRRILRAGELLAQDGRLDAPEDVWDLAAAALARGVQAEGLNLRAEVARERGRIAAWQRVEVPWSFRSEDLPLRPIAPESGAVGPGSPALEGTPAAPGMTEGTVHVLEAHVPPAALPADAVLVTTRLEPGWTPLLACVVGVVTEMGGMLSHASIVARELGVPCVTDVSGATRLLRTGTRVLVDGDRGTVSPLGDQERT